MNKSLTGFLQRVNIPIAKMSFQSFLQSLVARAAEDPVCPDRKKESTQWNQYGIVNIIFVISVERVLQVRQSILFVCLFLRIEQQTKRGNLPGVVLRDVR